MQRIGHIPVYRRVTGPCKNRWCIFLRDWPEDQPLCFNSPVFHERSLPPAYVPRFPDSSPDNNAHSRNPGLSRLLSSESLRRWLFPARRASFQIFPGQMRNARNPAAGYCPPPARAGTLHRRPGYIPRQERGRAAMKRTRSEFPFFHSSLLRRFRASRIFRRRASSARRGTDRRNTACPAGYSRMRIHNSG